MNYRKWRLARANFKDLYHEPTLGYTTERDRYIPYDSDDPITKQSIDENPDKDTNRLRTSSHNHGRLLRMNSGLDKVLEDLKYVVPGTPSFLKPHGMLTHLQNAPPSSYVKYDKYFTYSGYVGDDQDSLHKALGEYAGSLLHNFFYQYTDSAVDPSSKHLHNNAQLPVLDEIEDSNEQYSPADVPESSIFHPKNLVKTTTKPITHRKSDVHNPRVQKMEDIGLVAGHTASELYKRYLDRGYSGTFEEYLEKEHHNPSSNKQRLIHELIRQLVQGWHLPSK